MTHTTEETIRVVNTIEHAAPVDPASREDLMHALLRSIFAMNDFARDADTDDCAEDWARGVMGRRPIYFVAALMPGQTLTWLMERREEAVVLGTNVSHYQQYDEVHRVGRATLEDKTYLLRQIEE